LEMINIGHSIVQTLHLFDLPLEAYTDLPQLVMNFL